MITEDWIINNLPEKVNSQEDFEKLAMFLYGWRKEANNPDDLYKFIINLDKNIKADLSKKIKVLLDSYVQWLIEKQSKLDSYLQTNQDLFSENTKKEILCFMVEDVERSKCALTALKCVKTIMET